MGNPYRHPISTPVPELQGIASIAAPPMTDDLVGRLRRDSLKYQTDTFEEAAARIEALKAALEDIADMETQQLAACAARAALEPPHAD